MKSNQKCTVQAAALSQLTGGLNLLKKCLDAFPQPVSHLSEFCVCAEATQAASFCEYSTSVTLPV